MKQPRYYQTNAINSVGNELLTNNVDKQMLVMSMGTGKTYTAVQIAKKSIFKRKLWLTHTEELIEQSALAFARDYFDDNILMMEEIDRVEQSGLLNEYDWMDKNPMLVSMELSRLRSFIGIVKQKRFDIGSEVVVASVQTMHRRLGKIDTKHFDLIIADECHLAASKTWTKTLDHFNPKLRLGLTATPRRGDGFGLGNIFDTIAYQYPIVKGIDDGYLCEIEAVKVQTDISLDDVRTTAGELNQGDLRKVDCFERNQLIVRKYKEYADGQQAIVFCVDVQHVLNLTEAFEQEGYNVDFVIGDKDLCPDRQERIQKFKNGETTIMVNCMVLTMGFDHPDASCVIMACPTKSETKFWQCAGRASRLKSPEIVKKFGQKMILLDIVDNTSKHKLVNSYTLDYGKRIEDRVFMPKEKKDELISRRESKLEGEMKRHDERVDLKDIPVVHVNMYSKAMKEPATPKQLAWLASLGYDIQETTYTKGMASQHIGDQPASDKQKAALKKWKYAVPEDLTRAQAQAAFAEIEDKHGKSEKSKEYEDKKKLGKQAAFLSEEDTKRLDHVINKPE